jgi:hypothetical protein
MLFFLLQAPAQRFSPKNTALPGRLMPSTDTAIGDAYAVHTRCIRVLTDANSHVENLSSVLWPVPRYTTALSQATAG